MDEMLEARMLKSKAIEALTLDQYEKAAVILEKAIFPGDWGKLQIGIKEKGKKFITDFHFSYGMYLRNLLRMKGFNNKESKSGNLDDIYGELLIYTLKKKCPSLERYLNETT